MKAYERLEQAIRQPKKAGKPAIMPYITSGFPSMEGYVDLLESTGRVADAIEVGVPFSDPMADGPTIQRSSRLALEAGGPSLDPGIGRFGQCAGANGAYVLPQSAIAIWS